MLVSEQVIEFGVIMPGKEVSGTYRVTVDSHYDIDLEFQSGKKLQKSLGYVTRGFDYIHEIIVTDTDIQISRNDVGGFIKR